MPSCLQMTIFDYIMAMFKCDWSNKESITHLYFDGVGE
jgi:uncharacterized protein YodC (DUF2158 family)